MRDKTEQNRVCASSLLRLSLFLTTNFAASTRKYARKAGKETNIVYFLLQQ